MIERNRRDNAKEVGAASPDSLPRTPNRCTANGIRYRLWQNLAARPDDFVIRNDLGNAAFKVDGRMLAERDIVRFLSPTGHQLCDIEGTALRGASSVRITGPAAEPLATVKRSLVTPLRDQFWIVMEHGAIWRVRGRILEYEYHVTGQAGPVAEVSRRWFKARDSYGIEVAPSHPDVVVLAVAVCLDLWVRTKCRAGW